MTSLGDREDGDATENRAFGTDVALDVVSRGPFGLKTDKKLK